MLQDFLSNLPPGLAHLLGYSRMAAAVLILLLGLVTARILQSVVKGLLLKLAAKTKSHLDEAILKVIIKPLWQTILLVSAGVAIFSLQPGDKAQHILLGSVETLIVIIWLLMALRLTTLIFGEAGERLTEAGKSSADLIPLLANLVRVLIFAGAIMASLSTWKINITPLLASAGIAGVAVALAAKDTLANFFGGISVFVDRPYKMGDYINLSSGERGEVVDIGIRSTRIQTRDDIQIIIPNATIASSKIINESAPEPVFRTRIKIRVAYGSDLDQVENLLLKVANDSDLVVREPAPRVRLRSFEDSGINFELLCWLFDPRHRGRAVHLLSKSIYKTFNENGVVIPYQQIDLHLHTLKADESPAGEA